MTDLSFVLFGNESILAQCGSKILDSGHKVAAIVTRTHELGEWAHAHEIEVIDPSSDVAAALKSQSIDWILSLAYLSVIPDEILNQAKQGAVNFHDGPLPQYAGLNTPVWARLNQENQHGITWHFMEAGIDKGDIIEQRSFPIEADDTAFTLNTKCFETAIESFGSVLDQLISGTPNRTPQSFETRKYFSRFDRPAHFGIVDFNSDAHAIEAMSKALDHQGYWNPLTTPKLAIGGRAYAFKRAEATKDTGHVGQVLAVTPNTLTVACAQGAVTLQGVSELNGKPVDLGGIIAEGDVLLAVTDDDLNDLAKEAGRSDAFWRKALGTMPGASLSLCEGDEGSNDIGEVSLTSRTSDNLFTATAIWAVRQQEECAATLAIGSANPADYGLVAGWKPLTLNGKGLTIDAFTSTSQDQLANAQAKHGFATDLLLRAPEIEGVHPPHIGFSDTSDMVAESAITVCAATNSLKFDKARISTETAELLARRLDFTLSQLEAADTQQPLSDISVTPEQEIDLILGAWNDSARDYDATALLHQSFEKTVAASPTKTALIFEDIALNYSELDKQANAIAARLNAMGVGVGDVVGLFIHRSPEMVAAALGILKSGAAYLSLDPAYPADRNHYCVEDSEAKAVVTHSAVLGSLPSNAKNVLVVDRPQQDPSGVPTTNSQAKPDDLAFMIYTSGSTGKPKGVMVEHRNVANFFAGMDDRVSHDPTGTWLAVTSLSFDISVLEIFWTLGHGFKLVLTGDEGRTVLSNGPLPSQVQGMDFSLYYWGNDDGVGRDKYRSLLEGAQFADKHGFCGVWTPERHFHAFGGPYPNPSVTGAAVAAVTRNLSVRAGSCVAPLHHSARIAEEWSVIDNLTNGRAGLAIASGWQPDDFVLRPENTPPENKPAMFKSIDEIRRLWAGEAVAFPKADGSEHAVVTQPRPVSKELPIWVTTAGNPETWRQAGEIGANVLTHLLGQSVDEVGEKIKIYHQALRENGHDPDDFNVTLMLHTYLDDDRDKAREVAREPMKDYLRSAAGLIKQYAWAFPAFKRPEGVDNAFQLDLGMLEEDELEAILDFAFLRYFDESGLFGTVADAMKRVEEVKRIGVTEIACLIDYGINADQVLEGLKPVAEVVRRCNEGAKLDEGDFSVAAQIIRHKVTHLQCTPSMARMFMVNDETRQAMGELKHIMLGGEALPGALVKEINAVSNATITNMYGPTETTIWSTTAPATAVSGTVNIGTPIANTKVYVLDEKRNIVPIGKPGELWIGGDGVARGYWKRQDLTAERFVQDPFSDDPKARMYQTGDLVQWRADGSLEYIGRTDFQVKVRGFRIELGEIEAAMDSHRDVTQSAVMVSRESEADVRLIGYFTAINGITEASLRAYLAEMLPAHMVPSTMVRLQRMPLTPNKKIDRNALARQKRKEPAKPQEAPKAVNAQDVSSQITDIWRSVLGNVPISGSDNFFDIGGHSLLAVQAHRLIREKLAVPKLSITDIFRFPVLNDLSDRVKTLSSGDTASPTPARTPEPVAAVSGGESKADLRSNAIERRRAMRARRKS